MSLTTRRTFHSSRPASASILFALNSLSNSRETQHFNKLTRLDRVEHSPPLKLIQTAEILPFNPSATTQITPSINAPPHAAAPTPEDNAKALLAGRAILADHAATVANLQRALDRSKAREASLRIAMKQRSDAWTKEKQSMTNDMRVAALCILASVGVATAMAMWRFWPVQASTTAPSATSATVPSAALAPPIQPVATASETKPVPSVVSKQSVVIPALTKETGRWWKSLFWRQQ